MSLGYHTIFSRPCPEIPVFFNVIAMFHQSLSLATMKCAFLLEITDFKQEYGKNSVCAAKISQLPAEMKKEPQYHPDEKASAVVEGTAFVVKEIATGFGHNA